MNLSDCLLHRPQFSSIHELKHHLKPSAAQALNQFADVLLIPPDIPRLPVVLDLVCNVLEAYGATLLAPNSTFRLLQSLAEELRSDVTGRLGWTTSSHDLAHPLLKRLMSHSPYALCLATAMLPSDLATRYAVAIGVEIACCMATGKAFGHRFANQLRLEITPQLFSGATAPDAASGWTKAAARKLKMAAELFESDSSPDPAGRSPLRLFDLKAQLELSRKLRYSAPRQRQALLDRHHQCNWQIQASAMQLLQRAQAADQTALLTLIAFMSGLSIATTKDMPIGSLIVGTESVMAINLNDGAIETNLQHLAPGAAQPLPDTTAFRAASWIVVKPLPEVVVDLLHQHAKDRPGAATLAELLPEATTAGRQLTVLGETSGIKATAARFLSTAGPIAVSLGIDRLTAALLANDFAVIPGSKLYYALSLREPVWDAAGQLYEALGWGPAVPFISGLPVGSHIVPARGAISEWLTWMAAEVKQLTPGRRCGVARLLAHHNAYACFCASITVWLLAAREAHEFHFTTHSLDPSASFASLIDKRVGIYPGELWLPLSPLLRRQLALWVAHCEAFECRLKKLKFPPVHTLMTMLERFTRGESVAMFFGVDLKTCRPNALGSADLTKWWPASHRFSADFGRHFWETELRQLGVRSSRIDLLLRHITQAVEGHCSTNGDVLIHAANEIITKQTELLHCLGFRTVPGLTARHMESSWLN